MLLICGECKELKYRDLWLHQGPFKSEATNELKLDTFGKTTKFTFFFVADQITLPCLIFSYWVWGFSIFPKSLEWRRNQVYPDTQNQQSSWSWKDFLSLDKTNQI
jgi:hypothetical protein